MVGSRRRSSAVGNRRSIKKGHLSSYYTIVTSELIAELSRAKRAAEHHG